MKVIVLRNLGQFELETRPDPPSPDSGHALVKIERIGICGTDLHAYRGRHPFVKCPRVLGHELGVQIEEVGDSALGLRAGDQCAVEPYLNCGRCIACRSSRINCCENLEVIGVHRDGGMCERLLVPVEKLHKSDTLSLEQLALIETLGIGAHGVDRAKLSPGENVLVIGAGPIGLGVIQFAQAAGANVIVMERIPHRRDFCRDQLNVFATLDPANDPMAELHSLTSGDLPTAVFDVTGNVDSMTTAFNFVASGGRLIFVGLITGNITFDDAEFHRRELTVFASRNATSEDFPRIIRMVEDGQIDTKPWITHRCEFDQIIDEFPSWLDPEQRVIKAMVSVS